MLISRLVRAHRPEQCPDPCRPQKSGAVTRAAPADRLSLRRGLRSVAALAIALALCSLNPAIGQPSATRTAEEQKWIAQLPSGEAWLTHFREDLLPFWNMPEAWGEPRGNFPTFRCNDGKLFTATNQCPELAHAPAWIKENAGREFVRMKSRQTYFYGVTYHLTGDPKMLELARDGVRYIRSRALDKESGSAVSYWEGGKAEPPVLQRTSQDLAYAQVGLAMYYYLTRDEDVLKDILRLKDHIFSKYWNAQWGMLMWVAKDEKHGEDTRKELVAQLDQINAYMLLLTPILPEPYQAQWKKDLVRLAYVMIEQYFAPEQHLFWGTIHRAQDKHLGSRHTDFGHTAKALWMIDRIGTLAGDRSLVDFAKSEAAEVLRRAYIPSSGSWGSRPQDGGGLDQGKEWWIYAELDELAATLALSDPAFGRHLPHTYDYWLKYLVDHNQHEVWGWVSGSDNKPSSGPKIHQWKNGYHSAEHALVAYLTTQALQGKPVTLYYAFATPTVGTRPYFFSGKVQESRAEPLPGFEGLQKIKMVFSDIR